MQDCADVRGVATNPPAEVSGPSLPIDPRKCSGSLSHEPAAPVLKCEMAELDPHYHRQERRIKCLDLSDRRPELQALSSAASARMKYQRTGQLRCGSTQIVVRIGGV